MWGEIIIILIVASGSKHTNNNKNNNDDGDDDYSPDDDVCISISKNYNLILCTCMHYKMNPCFVIFIFQHSTQVS